MPGRIQFDDEFNYRSRNYSRPGVLKTRKKRLTLTQKLIKIGLCKNQRGAERFLIIFALICFATGVLFTVSVLNPAIKYKMIFKLEGKQVLSDDEARVYIDNKIMEIYSANKNAGSTKEDITNE